MRAWLSVAALAALRDAEQRESRTDKAGGQTLVSNLVESFDLDCWTSACHGIALECAATDTVCGQHLACGAGPRECFGSATVADLSTIESDLFECGKEHRCDKPRAPSSFVGSLDRSQGIDFEAFLNRIEEKGATYLRNLGHTFYNAVTARAIDKADNPDPTEKLQELRDLLKSGKLQVDGQSQLEGMLHKIDLIQVGLQNSEGTEQEKAVMRNSLLPHLSLILSYVNNPPPPLSSSLIAMRNEHEQSQRLPDSLVQLLKKLGTKNTDFTDDAHRYEESFNEGYGKAREAFGLPAERSGANAASGAGSLVESSAKPAYPGAAAMSAVVDKIAAYNAKLSSDFPGLRPADAGAGTPAVAM